MARWTEVRGYTLIFTQAGSPDRYARAALVRKRTLLGSAYNVREARAEDSSRSGREPEALGMGRMLSWRWLSEGEAEELLSARLRTLEALGYGVVGQGEAEVEDERGAWDWLRELVDRQLLRASPESEAAAAAGATGEGEGGEVSSPAQVLRETLDTLKLEPEALLEGLSTILPLDEQGLREPEREQLEALGPELLAMLLPVWLGHESRELRTIGERWLALPTALFELEAEQVASWAEGPGTLARSLAPHVEDAGLALLGPDALVHLAKVAEEPRMRAAAETWRARLV